MKYGIDISHWNNNIDFHKVNKDFVIMKVSQGTYKDPKFDEYYNGFKIPKGAYIYNKVKSVNEALKEAEFAVKCLQGKKLEYGVWLDMEDAVMRSLGKKVLTDIILTEASVLKAAGFKVGIYCNRDWYLNVLDSKTLSDMFPFWVARYPFGDNGNIKESLSPKDLKGCKIWQYSSKGKVEGMNGNVDLNIQYYELFEDKEIKNKSVDDIAHEVLDGLWGNGTTRKLRLEQAGYSYDLVQKRVNELLKAK